MLVAAVCWSTGGLLVRKLSITNAWEIVFWRSLFMSLFVAVVLVAMHGRAMPRAVRAAGYPGVLAGLLLAGTFFFFIGSVTRTTVANTFVLMSVSPLLAALAGWFVLRERVPARTWIAMAFAFAGIVVMFGSAVDAGQIKGNLMALGVSVCFVAQLTVLRKFHATVDMLPMVMIAGLWSIVPAWLLAGSLRGNEARSRRPGLHGLRAAWRGLPARDRRFAHIVGQRIGIARACWNRSSVRFGCGRCWVSIRERSALVGRRICAVRGHRQRGDRRAARTRRRRAGAAAGALSPRRRALLRWRSPTSARLRYDAHLRSRTGAR